MPQFLNAAVPYNFQTGNEGGGHLASLLKSLPPMRRTQPVQAPNVQMPRMGKSNAPNALNLLSALGNSREKKPEGLTREQMVNGFKAVEAFKKKKGSPLSSTELMTVFSEHMSINDAKVFTNETMQRQRAIQQGLAENKAKIEKEKKDQSALELTAKKYKKAQADAEATRVENLRRYEIARSDKTQKDKTPDKYTGGFAETDYKNILAANQDTVKTDFEGNPLPGYKPELMKNTIAKYMSGKYGLESFTKKDGGLVFKKGNKFYDRGLNEIKLEKIKKPSVEDSSISDQLSSTFSSQSGGNYNNESLLIAVEKVRAKYGDKIAEDFKSNLWKAGRDESPGDEQPKKMTPTQAYIQRRNKRNPLGAGSLPDIYSGN